MKELGVGLAESFVGTLGRVIGYLFSYRTLLALLLALPVLGLGFAAYTREPSLLELNPVCLLRGYISVGGCNWYHANGPHRSWIR